MAYALGLPSEITAIIQDMWDIDYETRGWRAEMQNEHKKNNKRSSLFSGRVLVLPHGDYKHYQYGFEFSNGYYPNYTNKYKKRIHAQGFEQFEAEFVWDEDDNGVIDVDSGRWEIHHQPAFKPAISVGNPLKYLSGKRDFKPWNKLKALG